MHTIKRSSVKRCYRGFNEKMRPILYTMFNKINLKRS